MTAAQVILGKKVVRPLWRGLLNRHSRPSRVSRAAPPLLTFALSIFSEAALKSAPPNLIIGTSAMQRLEPSIELIDRNIERRLSVTHHATDPSTRR